MKKTIVALMFVSTSAFSDCMFTEDFYECYSKEIKSLSVQEKEATANMVERHPEMKKQILSTRKKWLGDFVECDVDHTPSRLACVVDVYKARITDLAATKKTHKPPQPRGFFIKRQAKNERHPKYSKSRAKRHHIVTELWRRGVG